MSPARSVLAVNAGSTSVKVSLLHGDEVLRRFDTLDDALHDTGADDVDVVAHRVVHGGDRTAPVVIDDAVRAGLESLLDLAPLHQRPALAAIDRCRAARPEVVQVACFDTAFHTNLPIAARTYALPERLRRLVRVYGFHGLSHAWASRWVTDRVPDARRVLIAHLGGGQSLCGVLDGKSAVTTMGFTPLDGLVMATRSGSLDPGAVVWLQQHTDEDLSTVLEQQSGLHGLCGTGDMREVLARAGRGDPAATLALDVYLHRFAVEAGGCVSALGGVDVLVFTGGVGQNSAPLRDLAARRLEWLGVRLDPAADPPASGEITAPGASVSTFVVTAREDVQMATEVDRLLDVSS